MTKLYKPGDKSRAICPHCAALVSTTFAYRDVPFDDGSGVVKGILAGTCDVCGAVASIPAQSTPAIRRARETADVSLEVSLPAPEVEILDAAAYRIDPEASARFRKSLIAYYVRKLRQNPADAATLKGQAADWRRNHAARKRPGVAIPNRRLSFKVSPRMDRDVRSVMEETGLTKTELVRAVVMKIEQDLIAQESPHLVRELQDIAAVVNA